MRRPGGAILAIFFANTRIHGQTSVFLMTFICKFALHDVKLLRQNGQWGGERGNGVICIYESKSARLWDKAQADYYYYYCYYYCYY